MCFLSVVWRTFNAMPSSFTAFSKHGTPTQITTWKAQLAEGAAGLFGGAPAAEVPAAVDLKTLHAKIGELTLENDFLSGALGKAGLLSAKR